MEACGNLESFAFDRREDELAFPELLKELGAGEESGSSPTGVDNSQVELLELISGGLLVVVTVGQLVLLEHLLLQALLHQEVDHVSHDFESFTFFFQLHVDHPRFVFLAERLKPFEFQLEALSWVNSFLLEELLDFGFDGGKYLPGFLDFLVGVEGQHEERDVDDFGPQEALLGDVLVLGLAVRVPLLQNGLHLGRVHGQGEEVGEVRLLRLPVLLLVPASASSSSTSTASIASASSFSSMASSRLPVTSLTSAGPAFSLLLLTDHSEVIV